MRARTARLGPEHLESHFFGGHHTFFGNNCRGNDLAVVSPGAHFRLKGIATAGGFITSLAFEFSGECFHVPFNRSIVVWHANHIGELLLALYHHGNGEMLKMVINGAIRYLFHGLLLLIGKTDIVLISMRNEDKRYSGFERNN
jgi:hypothetical protein